MITGDVAIVVQATAGFIYIIAGLPHTSALLLSIYRNIPRLDHYYVTLVPFLDLR